MFRLCRVLIFFIACISMVTLAYGGDFHESDAQVWKVGGNRWTIHDEYDYGAWIEANITEDFFIRHNLRVDCADVPYAIRWIYARIHHLPAAARTADNQLIGHWSRDWAHLPTHTIWHQDKRFLAALKDMLSSTSTQTLPSDTYPIQIGLHSVTVGTTFLTSRNHAGIVSRIIMDGSMTHPLQTFEATSPARLQRLRFKNFIIPNLNYDRVSGLLKFRWPVYSDNQWHYRPIHEHPFYSDEQYTPAFTKGYENYLEAVAKRIDPVVYEPGEKVEKIIRTLARQLYERIPIVLEGHQKCQNIQCPEGSLLWELYGTYNRDEFIGVLVHHLENIIQKNHLDQDVILDKMEKIRLPITPERFMTLRYVFQNFKWMSSNPEATVETRWGLDKCNIINAHLKSAQESITFIQTKYGRTEPRFARRSILRQQKIVDDMIREIRENNCKEGAHLSNP